MRALRIPICALFAAGLLAALAPAPAAATSSATLRKALRAGMRAAGPAAGAYVVDATGGRRLFAWREGTRRSLASNTKLFTTAAALRRFGPDGTLQTTVLGLRAPDDEGTVEGDLYLRGAGDPTFGTSAFIDRFYGRGARVETLARRLDKAGLEEVRGRIVGDESLFDSRRGVFTRGPSVDIGPLSALSFNRGLANEGGSAFQLTPPAFAAARLERALERRGIRVRGSARRGVTPRRAVPLATVDSPDMAGLAQLTNKQSDNFFAEMLMKLLGARDGRPGSTAAGTRAARRVAASLGAPAAVVDGSGLSRRNRASPRAIVRLLRRMRSGREAHAFEDSLAVAGRDGTLRDRMRRGRARGRCRAKTGTLRGVSTLSGYCRARNGHELAFSFLMNGVSILGARRIQDRMAQALARWG